MFFPAEIEIGFHGHHNLAMGVANSLAAVEAGATRIDGSVAGFGAGAGNTPLEVFAAVCDMYGIETGIDVSALDGCCRRRCRAYHGRPIATH